MRKAMADAEVGDDVYRDDPTVNRLEAILANRSEKEAALLLPSGTQSNLVALLSHCQRGDEYIAGQEAHIYKCEGGGGAVLGSIQPQPIKFEADRTLGLEKVAAKIKADDSHFARTKLLCLENTQGGIVLPRDYHAKARLFSQQCNLALHLDGARLFNALVKQQLPLADVSRHYDSVSLCLSKGLGSPMGSVLVGEQGFIKEARRWRKMVGGGMRQAGIIAAAGIYALENNIERLEEDHFHAEILASGLAALPGIDCDLDSIHTNIFYIQLADPTLATGLKDHLQQQGILISLTGDKQARIVTHKDISAAALEHLISYQPQSPLPIVLYMHTV